MNLDELTKLEAAMTPGEWTWSQGSYRDATLYLEAGRSTVLSCVYSRSDGDSVFPEQNDMDAIVALRNAAPALIAAARERDELAALLREANGELDYMSEPKGKDRDHDLRLRIDAALARLGVPE
jgi:hypothetical protein